MDWHVSVITTKREVPTLETTLNSLADAGWDNVAVYSDRNKRGPYWNWRYAVAYTYARIRRIDASRVLISEDDALYTRGLRKYLDRTDLPDGVVSLYTASPNHRSDSRGWNQVSTIKPIRTYGALAITFPTYLLPLMNQEPAKPEWTDKTDHAIGLWCRMHEVPYWCHTPSFVKHIGDNSTLAPAGHPEYRQCKSWKESIR